MLWVVSGRDGDRDTYALLYPVDAGAWTRPELILEVDPPQQLPPVPVGGVVEVDDLDADQPRVVAGGVTLRGTRRREAVPPAMDPETGPGWLAASSGRPAFGEARGGPTVVHPDHGELSAFAWSGQSDLVASSTYQSWTDWLRESTELRKTVAAAVIFLVVIVVLSVTGTGGSLLTLFYVSWLTFVAVRAVRTLRRRKRVTRELAELPPDAPSQRMLCRVWLATGEQRPVEPWVTLYLEDDKTPVVSLPVIGLPEHWHPSELLPCEVTGDPAPGRALRIVVLDGEQRRELHPGDLARDDVFAQEVPR